MTSLGYVFDQNQLSLLEIYNRAVNNSGAIKIPTKKSPEISDIGAWL
jgi:hypothetical protein